MTVEIWRLTESTIDETRPYLLRVERRGQKRYTRRPTTEHELKREGYRLDKLEEEGDEKHR